MLYHYLRNNAHKIHFFGLGFIQIKINDHERWHFYVPELPRFVEDPHNHRYDFESQIIYGMLTQAIFEVVEGKTHLLDVETCGRKITPEFEVFKSQNYPKEVGLKRLTATTMVEGSAYSISADTLHTVKCSGPTITKLRRSTPFKDYAEIVRPKFANKNCPFSKQVPEDKLWSIVEKYASEISRTSI